METEATDDARVCREKNIVSSYQPNQIYLKLSCTARPKKRHRLLELVSVTWSEATRRL